MAKKLEELLPLDVPKELDGNALFEHIVGEEVIYAKDGGKAMSSGCVACNNGGGGCVRYIETNEKPYKE